VSKASRRRAPCRRPSAAACGRCRPAPPRPPRRVCSDGTRKPCDRTAPPRDTAANARPTPHHHPCNFKLGASSGRRSGQRAGKRPAGSAGLCLALHRLWLPRQPLLTTLSPHLRGEGGRREERTVYPDWSRASVRACASISTRAAATLPRTAAQCSAVCCRLSRPCTPAPFCARRQPPKPQSSGGGTSRQRPTDRACHG